MSDTIWDRLKECVQYLSEPFRASEIVGWFRRHYPDVKEQSLRAHIQGATSNASAESRGMFASRYPFITRIEHGLYRRFDGDAAPVHSQLDRRHDRVLTQASREVDTKQLSAPISMIATRVRGTPRLTTASTTSNSTAQP